ncbi:MAG: hypothetical protein ABIS17_03185 [Casimicrobiaceae bacterium]
MRCRQQHSSLRQGLAAALCVGLAAALLRPALAVAADTPRAPGVRADAPAERAVTAAPHGTATDAVSTHQAGVASPPVGRSVTLKNAGFEEGLQADGEPAGWITGQHAGVPSYAFIVDDKERHGGKRSLRIDNTGPEPFGAIVQKVPVTGLLGKSIRMKGWVKTRDAGGKRKGWGAALQLQAKKAGYPIAYNALADHVISGTHDWMLREVVIDVPSDVDIIEIGVLLRGQGSVWLDDVVLEVMPPK